MLYSSSGKAFGFSYSTQLNIVGGKINYWITPGALPTEFPIPYLPLYAWIKIDQSNLEISGTTTSLLTTINLNNLSPEDILLLPAIELLQLQTVSELEIITLETGELEILDAPELIRFMPRNIISRNPIIAAREISDITVTVSDSRIYSSDWKLYASINGDLTTQDGKYSLPGAIIFVDEEGNINGLSQNPIQVYSGNKNDGNTKITQVSWDYNKGILMKTVDEPFRNGKEYKAIINWTIQ